MFTARNIENLIIPNFIEIIGPYAFNGCKKIQTIEFPIDSKVQIIKQYAFYYSSIKKIIIIIFFNDIYFRILIIKLNIMVL